MIGLQSTSISPLPIAYIITLIIIPAKGFGRIPGRKASPTRPMAEQASEVTIHTYSVPYFINKFGTK